MVGPRMLALMLIPLVIGAIGAAVLHKRNLVNGRGDFRFEGIRWVLLAVVVEVVRELVVPARWLAEPSVGRAFALVDVGVGAWLLYLNRFGRKAIVVASAVAIAGTGVLMNAAAVMIAGAMPFSERGAQIANLPPSWLNPVPRGYVPGSQVNAVAGALGDIIPFPAVQKVLSLGDVLILSGLLLGVAVMFARMLVPDDPVDSSEHDPLERGRMGPTPASPADVGGAAVLHEGLSCSATDARPHAVGPTVT
jgi:hypothetical protein